MYELLYVNGNMWGYLSLFLPLSLSLSLSLSLCVHCRVCIDKPFFLTMKTKIVILNQNLWVELKPSVVYS